MLSPSEEKFCRYMLNAKSEKIAYRDAFPEAKNLKEQALAARIYKLKHRHDIVERIKQLRDGAANMAQFELREAILELIDIATADPNEIIQHRRIACRYCHGVGHRRMWDWSEYADELSRALIEGVEPPDPVSPVRGGVGYDRSAAPHPDCPECYGDGVGEVWLADTRELRGKAAKLYAGVEVTKNGIKVHMRDQDAALRNLTAALGGFLNVKPGEGKGAEQDPAAFLKELGMLLPN